VEKLKTRLSTKGQVILPKAIRESHHLQAGAELEVETTASGILLRPISPFRPKRLEEIAGRLKPLYEGKTKTIKEMDAAVLAEAKSRVRR